ncbi:[citrate (pro-3S)-lyase] ligase [Fusibacter ferrireducens]|uniref:[Citrate [pro-3S]-lyase] ligase n=1 Tax=Fusibacter ferrireducens TaxID=2785058 RepID=A0ABR9ZXV0_9FIRM|nr:[citrate (pro-3S)-lyase] ligase [Fusibacter ferrireducens]MBF4695292.1 [citrate (pro-3S)-lyase] ligase [Fusibacter ferrireducens]
MIEKTFTKEMGPEDFHWQDILNLIEMNDIKLDPNVEHTFGIFKEDKLLGTASTLSNTIRSIAINSQEKGSNILGELIHEVMQFLYDEGYSNIFIYTKCESAKSFEHIGFYEIERVESKVVLLERKPHGIKNFACYLKSFKTTHDHVGAIVMNGNPFTLGHQYLVEYAASNCDFLYIFVVDSTHTSFPSDDRYKLILSGTSHLDNVYVIKGSDYIISDATFPTYFLKRPEEGTQIQTELDLKIFGHYFAESLNITKRFVGTEPYCGTTSLYNEQMKRILPHYGVEIVEIPRKVFGTDAISASRVRVLLAKGNMKDVKKLVPESTYQYFKTVQGKQVIEKLKDSTSRH